MPLMDDTQIDSLLSDLESAEPAEAPDKAEAVASLLARALDDLAEEAPPAAQT